MRKQVDSALHESLVRMIRAFVAVVVLSCLAGYVQAAVDGFYYSQNGIARAYFTGTVVYREDANIDFNFGTGAPVAGVGTDDFSVVWVAELETPASGAYRFETVSDDGVRFYLDDALLIENWTDHAATANQSGLVTLTAGQRYAIRMEFYERGGDAVARLRWEGPGFAMQAIPANRLRGGPLRVLAAEQGCGTNEVVLRFSRPLDAASAEDVANYVFSGSARATAAVLEASGLAVRLTVSGLNPGGHTITLNDIADVTGAVIPLNTRITTSVPANGLRGTYFDQDGTPRAYFTGNTHRRVDATVAFDFGNAAPAPGIGVDDFSIRWEGELEARVSGRHQIVTRSDDGVRVYLDDNLLIDNWTDHAATLDASAELTLTAGRRYRIVMEHYERGGQAVAELRWRGPDFAEEIIPSSQLFPLCGTLDERLPIAEWRHDEPAWTGTSGEVFDWTGNGHDGRAENGAQTAAASPALPGDPGTCGYGGFDAGEAQRVRIPHAAALNPRGSFTVTAWVRVTGGTGAQRTVFGSQIDRGPPGPPTRQGFHLAATTGNRWEFWTGGGATPAVITGGSVALGTWVHLAAVFAVQDEVGGALRGSKRLYLNGGLIAVTNRQNYVPNPSAEAFIGAAGENGTTAFFAGDIDEVRLYHTPLTPAQVRTVMDETHPCTGRVNHYAISHAGLGVTCEAEAVTIRGRDASLPTPLPVAPNTTIDITTVPATAEIALKAGTPGNFIGGTGSARYTFAGGETAVELWLRQTTPAVLDIDVIDVGNVTEIPAADPPLEFRDVALRFVADGVSNAIGTQLAGKSSAIAPGAQTLGLRVVETDAETGACVPRLTAGPQPVDFAVECREPASCALPAAGSLNGTPLPGSAAGPIGAWQSVPLDFDGDALAPLELRYLDAGRIALHARLALPDTPSDPPLTLTGTSNAFVIAPAGLCVEALAPEAACPSTDIACSVFRAAGEPFALAVRGVGWESAGEADSAFCSGNAVTPNFRLDNIALSPRRLAPASGGVDGLLGRPRADISAGGSALLPDQTVSEVGVFDILATPPAYLDVPLATSRSAPLGRFRPAYFTLTGNTPMIAPACSGFTYLDQPFHYAVAPRVDVEARNAGGELTVNYRDDFYRLETTLPRAYVDRAGAAGTLNVEQQGTVTVSGTDDLDGSARLRLPSGDAGDAFRYTRGTPGAPFPARFDLRLTAAGLTDADGACYEREPRDGSCDDYRFEDIGGSEMRHGRLRLESAFGSELVPLALPVRAEYFDGASFATNTADTCTTLALGSTVTLANPATAGGTPQAGTSNMVIGGGTTAIGSGDLGLASGAGALVFEPPGAGNTGYVDVGTLLGDDWPWLLFDWDGDGTLDDPRARASFGLFPGRNEIIYIREPWD